MINLHPQILGETDCRPITSAESLDMCRQAAADGVQTIIATPYLEEKMHKSALADYEQKLNELQQAVGGTLSLRLGFLLRFGPSLPQLMEQYGTELTLGDGRYLLISLPSLNTPPEADEAWSELAEQGFSVIIAHPECSSALRNNPEPLERWTKRGVMLQVDAASLIGAYGRDVQRFAWQCLRKYEDHIVVASNSRGVNQCRPSLGRAREELIRKVGVRRTRKLMTETPAALLSGGTVPAQPPRNLYRSIMRALKPERSISDVP